jgi:hypothetical protein
LKAVIHQPQYFPYPGFFHKLSLADVFIIMDNTQYDKRFTNRNKIIVPNGSTWISVPINKEHKFSPNNIVEINNNVDWRKEHWGKIRHSYSKSKFFHLYKEYFEKLYVQEWNHLFDLDYKTLLKTIDWLGLKIKIIKESELNLSGEGTMRLINGCKAIGADTYVTGSGLPGKKYMDESLFEKNNINIIHQDYKSVIYEQNFSESFIPDLSIIDLLFNLGPDSLDCIKKSHENN